MEFYENKQEPEKAVLIAVDSGDYNCETSLDELEELAKANSVKYQVEVMGSSTGTNADDIAVSAGGKKTALLSIPQRNMHTAVEIIDLDDIESTAQLMAAYILGREDKSNA